MHYFWNHVLLIKGEAEWLLPLNISSLAPL